jgi:hypothetical protein
MGREVFDQVGMLEDLESGVENSQNRLDKANKKLKKFIQDNKSEQCPLVLLWRFALSKNTPDCCRFEILMDDIPAHDSLVIPVAADHTAIRRGSVRGSTRSV